MKLYDAHNHLQDRRLDKERDGIVASSVQAGMAGMVVNGTCEEDWPAVEILAAQWPDLVIPAYGLHPWRVADRSPAWREQLAAYLDRTPATVGEIGLDRWKEDLCWEGQEEICRQQLDLAAERNRPVSIHCLKAWGPLLDVLTSGPLPACGFLLHSYGGSVEMGERFAELGATFSFPGAFLRASRQRHRDTFRRLPPERVLMETDAPDQALPRGLVRHTLADRALNHPANLVSIYEQAAMLFGETPAKFAERMENNFRKVFNPSPRPGGLDL